VFDDRMIPEVRACSTPSGVAAPTGHTERTPEPWVLGVLMDNQFGEVVLIGLLTGYIRDTNLLDRHG
jgi:hypothetical protein